jgi:hypothetical protein
MNVETETKRDKDDAGEKKDKDTLGWARLLMVDVQRSKDGGGGGVRAFKERR